MLKYFFTRRNYIKVKYYIIEKCYEFMDALEKELCQKGISYVRIDTEIHFLDQIIRFIDFDIYKDLIVKETFFKILLELNDVPSLLIDINFDSYKEFYYENITYKKIKYDQLTYNNIYYHQNKKTLKNESNNTKQKLKKYKR